MLKRSFSAMAAAGDSDASLVARLRNREAEAMADLYSRFSRLVWSVVLHIVREEGPAEDLTQEIFLRVWNNIDRFQPGPGGNLAPWLVAIARNRAIDYRRSTNARIESHIQELDFSEYSVGRADVERDVFNAHSAHIIKEAIAKLDHKQRTVIDLAYFEGLSQSEIAERLGEPLGTVKGWARSALKNLRQNLSRVIAA
jgi:RNA polymerase sigma-70 factor (ECF subfamily)